MDDLKPDTHLRFDLHLNDEAFFDLLDWLEAEYGHSVSDSEVELLQRVQDVVLWAAQRG